METVFYGKFISINEINKDGKNYYFLSVLQKNDNGVYLRKFFLDQKIALNMGNFDIMDDIGINLALYFDINNKLNYRVTKII